MYQLRKWQEIKERTKVEIEKGKEALPGITRAQGCERYRDVLFMYKGVDYMKFSLIPEECPKCKKLALVKYINGLNAYLKCKECDYQKELPSECNKGNCGCC